MRQLVPEIYVRDCRAALNFYRGLFGGHIRNLKMSEDLPLFQQTPGMVIHSELHVSPRCIFYFMDILDERRARPGNVSVVLHLDSRLETERIYRGLALGGAVRMRLQPTQLGEMHAIVTDRYGAPWTLSCNKL